MYKIVLLLVVFTFAVSFAQEKGNSEKKSEEVVKYTLKSNFPVNVQHVYEVTDTSKFVRQFSDSTKKTYTRILKYYFSAWAPSAPNKEKIQNVTISVDSLEYKLITVDGEVFYHSQADDLRPPKIDDYVNAMIPLGLEFDFVYSPYQEAGNISGDIYKGKIYMLNDPKTKPSDSIYAFLWNDKLGKTALTTYFDIVKSFYPINRIAIDSSWNKKIIYDIEGATIVDSAQFVLKSFNIKSFIIEGTSIKTQSSPNDKAVLSSIRNIVDVENLEGKSDYYIRLQAKGTLEELRINSDFNINYKLKNDIINQHVNTNRTWKLIGMYKI